MNRATVVLLGLVATALGGAGGIYWWASAGGRHSSLEPPRVLPSSQLAGPALPPAPRCASSLELPFPACVTFEEAPYASSGAAEVPLLAPQVIAPGAIRVAVDAAALLSDAEIRRATGSVVGTEYALVDMEADGDRIVHVGRCPTDAGYLAAYTLDVARNTHLLCLEYVTTSMEWVPTSDPTFDLGRHCRGPRAWHGTVRIDGRVDWSAPSWLSDVCEDRIRQNVVLAVAQGVPIVAYVMPSGGGGIWRALVLRAGSRNHWLGVGFADPSQTQVHDFFVSSDTLSAIVTVPDAQNRYEFMHALVRLDVTGRLSSRLLVPGKTMPAPLDFFPLREAGRSPRPITTWSSDDAGLLSTLLPLRLLEPLDEEALNRYPTAQPFAVANAVPPSGWRPLGPGVAVFPLDDGETGWAKLEFPRATTVELDGRRAHWIRATCSDSCVATYRYSSDEQSAFERYSASFHVLRIRARPTSDTAGMLSAGSRCRSLRSGYLSCAQKD